MSEGERIYYFTIVAIALVLLAGGSAAISQEFPKAILVEEHGSIPCDDSSARLDAFYLDLYNHPGSTGFISIANAAEKRRDSIFRKDSIELYARMRQFDVSRIKIVRTLNDGEMRITFWRVPPGATDPTINIDDSYEVPRTTKSFMFGWEDNSADDICPPINHGEIFARFLKANPHARANLVSREDSILSAKRNATAMVTKLVKRYGVPRGRIRIFLQERKRSRLAAWAPDIEFWFLP
jgi:hypothetical protein